MVKTQQQSETTKELAAKTLFRYQQMCARRDGWRRIFALLSKYILSRPTWFGDTQIPYRTPQLSVQGVSDDTTVDTARTSATSLCGALWPNTANTFELIPKIPPSVDETDYDSAEIQRYCEKVTHIVRHKIDAHESGFHIANAEYLDDQVVYGTSGIYVEEVDDEDDCPLRFHAISIETAVVDEGASGFIDTVYLEFAYTARQVVEKYGLDKVSEKVQAMYNGNKKDDYVKVIQALQPRMDGKYGAPVLNKPYASIHMEVDTKQILKESGMDEAQAFVTRFRHRPGELYGRSLAMDALPTVKEMNILRRAYSLALEKILDPPYGYYPDQLGGSSTFSISAGAKIPLFDNGRSNPNQPPVVQLLKINEPQVATQRLAELQENMKVKFLVDRLLDFNNESRMTLGEAEMRGDFRNLGLGPIFSRQIIEQYNPLIKCSTKILYRKKMLGLHPVRDAVQIARAQALGRKPFVIPVLIAALMDQGKFPLEVRFISPAARAMKADSVMGAEKLTNFIMTLENAGIADAKDNIDTDKLVRFVQDAYGAPLGVMRSVEDVKALRKEHAKQNQQAMALQQGEVQASIQDKTAGATKKYAQAGLPQLAPGMQQPQQPQPGSNLNAA